MKTDDYLSQESLKILGERWLERKPLTSFRWTILVVLLTWALIFAIFWAAFE